MPLPADTAKLKQLLAQARSRCRRPGPAGEVLPGAGAGPAALQSANGGHEQPAAGAGGAASSKQAATRPRSAGRAPKLGAAVRPASLQPAAVGHKQPPAAPSAAAAGSPPPGRLHVTARAPPASGAPPAVRRRAAPQPAGAADAVALAHKRWQSGTTRATAQPAAAAVAARTAASAAARTAAAVPDALEYATRREAVAQLDAADWQVLELLQAAAEAGGPWQGVRQRGTAPPSGQARTWQQQQQQQQQHMHSRRYGNVSSSRYGQPPGRERQQPLSPLARQLAALRRGAEQAAGGGAGWCEAAANHAGERMPASGLGACAVVKHSSAVSLLVPQELLAEAAQEAAAGARRRSSCRGAPPPPPLCTDSLQQPASVSAQPGGVAASSGHAMQAQEHKLVLAAAAVNARLEAAAAVNARLEAAAAAELQALASAELRAAAAAAQLEAAAAELRMHCWHGRYEEARQVLREAGEHAGQFLLAAGDAAGRTPLMQACSGGHGKLVKLLLRKGAAMDMQDAQGNTALLLAVMHSQRAVARHLLECGADASRRNAAGACGADLIAAWAAQQQGDNGGNSGVDG